MLDFSKTYIYERKEYKLTGRVASAIHDGKIPTKLLEITPVDVDKEDGVIYNKWVMLEDLYTIKEVERLENN